MRVAITGATGFIGRIVNERICQNPNIQVLALSRSTRSDCVTTDYSYESLVEIFEGVDVVVHLAGTKGTKTEMSDYETDRVMTENILKAMVACKVGKIIYASSRLVYGNPNNLPWSESTVPEPRMAYAKNKILLEEMCRKYSAEYGFKCMIVRIAQVLGIGEGTRTMINVFQDVARAKGEITVIGRSVAKRQYIYTKDLAEAIYRLTVNDYGQELTVNVGMCEAYSNLEIAECVNRAFENETPINYDDSSEETITSSYMNVDRMSTVLGLKPMTMEEALKDMY